MTDPEFDYLIGVLLGDGSVYKKKVKYINGESKGYSYCFQLMTTSQNFAFKFIHCLKNLNFNPHIGEGKTDRGTKLFKVSVFNKELYKKLKEIKEHPLLALKQVRSKQGFLQGFYDSEGCYTIWKTFPRIRMYNTNKDIIAVVVSFLKDLGFTPKVNEATNNKGIRFSTICLNRKEEVGRFKELMEGYSFPT